MSYEMVLGGGSDEWTDIVGEQTRGGGQNVIGEALEVLGLTEAVSKSPAFKQYIDRRAAASRPMLTKTPMNKARDWPIDFPVTSGTAGGTAILTVNPQVLFRGEKIMATDTWTTPGMGTSIGAIFVGQKSQRPANASNTLTLFFSQQALGNGIKWDTCEKALSISMTVSFVQTCTFYATVFGKAVL